MAPNPLLQATASSLAVVVERVKPRVWPLSKKSLPTWLSVLSTLVIAFFRVFALRMRSNAFARAHAKQREAILATMEVIDKFVRDKDAAARADPANEQKVKDGEEIELDCLPEASRVFRLLWDDVQECRTTRYGFEPSDGRNRSAEALVKRLTALELRQAIRLTRKARDPAVETTSQEESRLLGEHSSGEKLEDKIKFATDRVRKRLGRDFVDAKLIREARALLWQVRSDQRRNLRLLWKLVAPVLPNIVLVFGLSTVREAMRAVFHQIGTWAIPLEAAVDGNWAVAKSYLSWLFCGHLIIDILNMLEGGYRQRACSSLLHNVRNGVMTAMVQQDYEFFDRNSPGVLQERLNHDAPQIGLDLVNRPNQIISKVFGIACNLYGAKIQVSNKVFFMAISPLVPVIACQNFLIRFIARMRDKERKIGEQAASNTGEVLREIRTVRQFAMERREVAEFTRSGNMREEMSERAVVFAGVMEIVFGLTIYGGLLGMLMTGAQDVVEGRLTVSQLLDVMMRLTFNVVFPARELIFEMPEILKMRAPLGRVCDLLESDPKIEPTAADQTRMRVGRPSELREILAACEDVTEGPFSERRIVVAAQGGCGEAAQGAQLISLTSGGSEQPVYEKCSVRPDDLAYPVTACFSTKVRPSRFHGLIEFQSVHFAYPTNPQKPVLKGVSFVVQPGKKVALVGGTGCGKSSIMALLQRLYQPQKGSIKVDGRPIEDYDANFLRSRMVIVDQNTVLFATTLRDNITYGLDGPVDDARVEQVCKDACAWAFIEGKPDSLMSEISTGGSNLSGGERQRVAIARAMIRRPDVILLDEATSALDTKNERLVQDALDKLARQGSALVIAHRLSTIQDSDKIIVVDQGVNMEEGTHSELLRKPSEEPKVGARRASVCLPLAPPVEPSRRGELPGEGSEEREARRVQELRPTEACSPFGPPLQLKRETSAPPVLSTAGAGPGVAGKASYRSLWETTTGSDGTMTVQQMQKRIDQLEGELAGLKGRMGKIRAFMREALDGMVPREASQVFPKSPRMATQDLA